MDIRLQDIRKENFRLGDIGILNIIGV